MRNDFITMEDTVTNLQLEKGIAKKLIHFGIVSVKALWTKNRKELKQLGFSDSEINQIMISLQLEGLDFNRKKY